MPVNCWQETEEAMEIIHASNVGDIISIRNKRYRVDKKTSTACSISRYTWIDRLWDKYIRRT